MNTGATRCCLVEISEMFGLRWVVPSEVLLPLPRPRADIRSLYRWFALCACFGFLFVSVDGWLKYTFERDCQRPLEAFLYTDLTPAEARVDAFRVRACLEDRGLTTGWVPSLAPGNGVHAGIWHRFVIDAQAALPAEDAPFSPMWRSVFEKVSAAQVSKQNGERVRFPDGIHAGKCLPLMQIWNGLAFLAAFRLLPAVLYGRP